MTPKVCIYQMSSLNAVATALSTDTWLVDVKDKLQV